MSRRILYITNDALLAGCLPIKLKEEGNEVLLFVKDSPKSLQGFVEQGNWEKRGDYIAQLDKEKDLVIYEDCNFGDEPSKVRAEGYSVIGGNERTDKMELDRRVGGQVARMAGIKVPEIHEVKDLDEARQYIIDNPRRYVLKQEGDIDIVKGLNFVSKFDDSRDLLNQIDWIKELWVDGLKEEFILQEYVEGREFACGSYWNGYEFMKDSDGDELCEENFEHKPLMVGNLGTATGEMHTTIRFRKAKDSKIFQETLEKIRPYLQQLDYRGCIDINAKVNEKGVYFLEFTNRFGSPSTSGHLPLLKTKWGDFLKAMADGNQINAKTDYRWLVIALLCTTPFPNDLGRKIKGYIEDKYEKTPPKDLEQKTELLNVRLNDSFGLVIEFKDNPTEEEKKHIHLDSIWTDGKRLMVDNSCGYVLTVSGIGNTVKEAGEMCEKILKKIKVAKGFWRNDFGCNYFESRDDLVDWNFLESENLDDTDNDLKKLRQEFYG